jgi:predicted Zn finger-like uncharacterized protein
MNVTCPNCATVYRIDPAKVPEAGVRARCNVCSAVFAVRREMEQGRPAPAAPQPAPVAMAESGRPAVREAPKAPPEPPKAAGPGPAAPTAPPSRPAGPQRPAAPAAGPPIPGIRPAAPPMRAAPSPAVPASPTAPAAAAAPAAAPRPPAPASDRPVAMPPAAPKPAAPAVAPAGAGSPRSTAPSTGRPTNPFLSQDPALKARRLARALISDMVVYHPGKRQEGLRDGNLKELFEEEIKKSWEEYADQVGRDVAESTAYFREALNEILAGGRQMF